MSSLGAASRESSNKILIPHHVCFKLIRTSVNFPSHLLLQMINEPGNVSMQEHLEKDQILERWVYQLGPKIMTKEYEVI